MIELSVSLASTGVVKVPGYEQLVRFGYTKNRGVYACTSMQPVSGQGWLSAASGTSRTAKTRHPRWWWTAMWPCPPA